MSAVDRVSIQYVADASDFEKKAQEVEQRWEELAERFREGIRANFSAESPSGMGEANAFAERTSSTLSDSFAKGILSAGVIAAPAFGAMIASQLRSMGEFMKADSKQNDRVNRASLKEAKKSNETTKLETGLKTRMDEWREYGKKHSDAANLVMTNNVAVARGFNLLGSAIMRTNQSVSQYNQAVRLSVQIASRFSAGLSYAAGIGVQAFAYLNHSIPASLAYVRARLISFSRETAIIFHRIKWWAKLAFTPIRWTLSIATWPLRGFIEKVREARREAGMLGAVRALIPFNHPNAAKAPSALPGLGSMGNAAKFGIGAGIVGVAALGVSHISHAITAYSDLKEKQAEMGEVFRSSEAAATQYVDHLASKYKIARIEATQSMSAFGQIFESTGGSSAQIEKMSEEMSMLAINVKSMKNISFSDAMAKLKSGLSGESEPLRALGVTINESLVRFEAYKMGIARVGDELSEGQKVMARYSLITKGLGLATGDLDRNFNSTANQLDMLKGGFANNAAMLGQKLEPAFNSALQFINAFMDWWSQKMQENSGAISEWVQWLKERIDAAKSYIPNLGLLWQAVSITAQVHLGNAAKAFYYIQDVARAVGEGLYEDFPGLVKEAFNNLIAFSMNWNGNMYKILTGGWDNIMRTFGFMFEKLLSKLDGMTGGMVSKLFGPVKSEADLAKDWQGLKQDLKLKDLNEGMDTTHWDKMKARVSAVEKPAYEDAAAKIAEIQGELADKLAKADADAKAKQAKAQEQGKPEPRRNIDMAAIGQQARELQKQDAPNFRFVNTADLGKQVQEGLLGRDQQKQQTEVQKNMRQLLTDQLIEMRRGEKKSSETVVKAT